MPYIIIQKVRKFHQSTINRFGTAGKKPSLNRVKTMKAVIVNMDKKEPDKATQAL